MDQGLYHQRRRQSRPGIEPGSVWLVGAGPGDAGLLTLHAVTALETADVILCDALVGEEILSTANPAAELVYVGKRCGLSSSKQDDINAALIDWAQRGKKVLRLKGGDPFVFGRGGEEALALQAADIPFRIVPGVTAGIGGLAYAGIPATHRGATRSVTFITGHDANGKMPEDTDWQGLAHSNATLVWYMALRQVEVIAQTLMDHGKAADMPVAIVSNASTSLQQISQGSLQDAANGAFRDATGPALFVIGAVTALADQLQWFSPAVAAGHKNGAGHSGAAGFLDHHLMAPIAL